MSGMDFLILIVPILAGIISLVLVVTLVNYESYALAVVSLLAIVLGIGITVMYYSARKGGFDPSIKLVEVIFDIAGAMALSTLIAIWPAMFIFAKTFPFFEEIIDSQENTIIAWAIDIGFLLLIGIILKYLVRSAWYSNILYGLPNNPYECLEKHHFVLAAGSYQYLDSICNIRFSLFINRLTLLLGNSKPLANAMTILGGLAAILSLVLQIRTNS